MDDIIGEKPQPIRIEYQGQAYLAFTLGDVKKLTAKNELLMFLKRTVELQHHRMKIYVMTINELKRLSAMQQNESEMLQDMYVRAKNGELRESWSRRTESWIYKLVIIGEVVAILALAL